jgi:Rieske Fe-S protein
VTTESTTGNLTRRHALTGAATLGLGLPLLAACGNSDGGGETATDPSRTRSAGSGSASGGGGGDALTSTSDIPVGGGTIFADQQVVVTQPAAGEFKGFSAVCTHQGCTVGSVSDGAIICPCHGSMFSIEDGSVEAGPASAPLAEVSLTVTGDSITLA